MECNSRDLPFNKPILYKNIEAIDSSELWKQDGIQQHGGDNWAKKLMTLHGSCKKHENVHIKYYKVKKEEK